MGGGAFSASNSARLRSSSSTDSHGSPHPDRSAAQTGGAGRCRRAGSLTDEGRGRRVQEGRRGHTRRSRRASSYRTGRQRADAAAVSHGQTTSHTPRALWRDAYPGRVAPWSGWMPDSRAGRGCCCCRRRRQESAVLHGEGTAIRARPRRLHGTFAPARAPLVSLFVHALTQPPAEGSRTLHARLHDCRLCMRRHPQQ